MNPQPGGPATTCITSLGTELGKLLVTGHGGGDALLEVGQRLRRVDAAVVVVDELHPVVEREDLVVVADRLENGKNSWHLSGEALKWDQKTDLVTSTTRTTLRQGSINSVGNELVIDLNTNEYRLGDNVRTKWRSATSSD